MNVTTKMVVTFVIGVHLMLFVLEAVFWMQPRVYSELLVYLDNPVSSDYSTQAKTLKKLFVNQGFYNLFLAMIGLWGMILFRSGDKRCGSLLILCLCSFALGAGVVLVCSTKAYMLAFFQAVPAIAGIFRAYPLLTSKP